MNNFKQNIDCIFDLYILITRILINCIWLIAQLNTQENNNKSSCDFLYAYNCELVCVVLGLALMSGIDDELRPVPESQSV